MNFVHKELSGGRWQKFTLPEQLSNIGAEVGRSINWRNKGKQDYSRQAFFRALELLYLTIDDPKHKGRLKELTRLYEILVDYFMGENIYGSSDELWEKYFYFFNFAARANLS